MSRPARAGTGRGVSETRAGCEIRRKEGAAEPPLRPPYQNRNFQREVFQPPARGSGFFAEREAPPGDAPRPQVPWAGSAGEGCREVGFRPGRGWRI